MATATKPAALTFRPHRFASFEAVNGRLAICVNTRLSDTKPVQEVYYRVSVHPVSDEYVAQFVGLSLSASSRYSGVQIGSRHIEFPDWDKWDQLMIEEECPKPRDGKEYGWRWDKEAASFQNRLHPERTGWVKENYSKCSNCHETRYTGPNGKEIRWTPYHSPEITPAGCGWCHKGGVCDSKGVCAPYTDR